MLALISAAALVVVPASEPRSAQPASGSIHGLFSNDDYPAEALDRNQQGDVGVLIKIDSTGSVSDCIVEKSSGAALLDERTCVVIRDRAKFKPARGRSGRPVASEMHDTVSWRIAEDLPEPSDPWASTVVMSYAANGDPLSCRVELEGAKAVSSRPEKCSAVPLPAELRQLGTITQLVIGQRFALGPIAPPQLGADEVLIGRMVLALEIDAAGKVISCTTTDASAQMRGADGCKLAAQQSFTPKKRRDGQPVGFSAMLAFRNVVRLQTPAAH